MPQTLDRNFYRRDTIHVARELLGKVLCRRSSDGFVLKCRILETEAYLGVEDPACHSYNSRRTPRVEAMYGEAGLSYVYFIYGVHFCLNVVTEGEGIPEAVLIRALEPLEGLERMKKSKPDVPSTEVLNGPGKLCAALQIDGRQNALDLVLSDELWIEEDSFKVNEILEGPRVGLGDKHDAVHWPLRFGLGGVPGLSKPRFSY